MAPLLIADPGVLNLSVIEASVQHPEGDAIQCDVLRGRANEVVAQLRALGIDERGSIVMSRSPPRSPRLAVRAGAVRPRFDEFAPVWEEVERGEFAPTALPTQLVRAADDRRPDRRSRTVDRLPDPDRRSYGRRTGVRGDRGAGLRVTRRDPALIQKSSVALIAGFSIAILASLLLGLVIRGAAWNRSCSRSASAR